MAIDQGTHATRAVLFDSVGSKVAEFSSKSTLLPSDSSDQVEYDAQQLLDSVHFVVRQVLQFATEHGLTIRAAGLATQRSSVVAWEAPQHGPLRPLTPMISWQDTRGAAWLESTLRPFAAEIKSISGLPLTAYYGGSKLRWLLKHSSEVQAAQQGKTLRIGPLAAFLIDGLVEQRPHLVDHANAGRTQLFDYRTQVWDQQLTRWFEIPQQLLPQLCANVDDYGPLMHTQVPLKVVQGDQTAALFGFGAPQAGMATVNLGTGAFVCLPQETPTAHSQLLSGIASTTANRSAEFVLEGTVNGCGAALDWAIEWLTAAGLDFSGNPFAAMEHAMLVLEQADLQAGEPPVLSFFNGVNGIGSPWWHSEDRRCWVDAKGGVFEGNGFALSGHTPGDFLAAVAESIVFLVQSNLDAMRSAGATIRSLRVSGGVSRSSAICRSLASLSGLSVERSVEREATAKGAAWLAAGRPAAWLAGSGTAEPTLMFEPTERGPLRRRYRQYVNWVQR